MKNSRSRMTPRHHRPMSNRDGRPPLSFDEQQCQLDGRPTQPPDEQQYQIDGRPPQSLGEQQHQQVDGIQPPMPGEQQ